ncbi:endolytic transglycosylase MltG [Roseomonas sp. NAR14]|uniref:Endolytic murein transglycosylase n=1 Tax=Roseomonas acroporae TaxID=2937791 RepID=A0A9X2BUF0_9PROT|nr:endolytic transglycosylase MltG [Roseomonas acroporae]MCK8785563.1 endolytic transglycosylase MltG [Roseomonas acroporae]
MSRFPRFLLGAASALALLAAAGGLAFWVGRVASLSPGPLETQRQVVVPRGGTETIAAALAEQGVIANPRFFALVAWLTRDAGPLRAAEFTFPAGVSLQDVLHILREGRAVQHRLTIPEGLTARQIGSLIAGAEALRGEMPAIDEGEVLPETYAYQRDDERAALVRRAEAAMSRALADAWKARAPDLPLATPREALILASIIERETGKPEERARVAAVFINRLRRGMPLQADSTVAYAAADGGVLDRPLSRADLERDSPFNTYRRSGLPPAPIASPGRETLRAATRPDTTDELYFVADGTGGHAFARTLEEHNRNVARWREGRQGGAGAAGGAAGGGAAGGGAAGGRP